MTRSRERRRTPFIRALGFAFLHAAQVGGTLLAAGVVSAQTVPLPVDAPNVSLDAANPEAVFTIDAGTFPLRAGIEVAAVPDASHPDLEIEVEVACTWVGAYPPSSECWDFGSGFGMGIPFQSSSTFPPGPALYRRSFAQCDVNSPWPGETCDVTVRALAFGSAGAPADVDIAIAGYTDIPSTTANIEYDPTPQPTSIALSASADTTIYDANTGFSAGAGDSMWTGLDYGASGGFPFFSRDPVRPLIQFDLDEPAVETPGKVPPGATITDATLRLSVIGQLGFSFPLEVRAITDRDADPNTTDVWSEGNADPMNTFTGSTSGAPAATWLARTSGVDLWNTPGAGSGPILDTAPTPAVGTDVTFNSSALTAEVARQYTEQDDELGFVVLLNGLVLPPSSDLGLEFGSRENPTFANRPQLMVQYIPATAAPASGTFGTDTQSFIGEGEDFRWIYDDDGDDVLLTDVGGRCVENYSQGATSVPWDYSFTGSPSFVGLDCCTWQIESQQTGVVGAGQAIFFLNLDASDPANQPGDLDGDGIRDLCDNCRYTANGPLLGSCVSPSGPYPNPELFPCRSDLECPAGDTCSLSQEDDDFTLPGIACPEPGFGLGLIAGGLTLSRRARRRR